MKQIQKISLWALLFFLFGLRPVCAGLIIQDNWQYTKANTSKSSDAGAIVYPLTFTNILDMTSARYIQDSQFENRTSTNMWNMTSATGRGYAYADEDTFGGNNASVSLVYAFDFLVDSPIVVGLSDHLQGYLSLGDTDSAHVDSFARIIDQATNSVIASLPVRVHNKKGTTGTDIFDERTPFSSHLFNLGVGDYLLNVGLNLNARATSGIGDDRMISSFSYTTSMKWQPVPEPATILLFGTGIAGLVGARIRRKK